MKNIRFKQFTHLILGMIAAGIFAPIQAQRNEETAYANQEEILEKRTANAKTFALPDGRYRAQIFNGAVHYQDELDQWQDINPAVQPSSDPAYAFENITNGIKSYFPHNLQTRGVKISSEQGEIEMGHSFTFSLDASLDSPQAEDAIQVDLNNAIASSPDANVVRYDGGHALGYVEYLVAHNQVKQQFILKQLPTAAANSSARYFSMRETINLPAGWSLLADGEPVTGTASTQGALQIRNASGEIVSGIPLPEIFEQQAGGQHLNPSGKMEQSFFVHHLAGTNQYQIKVSIPMTWLQAPGRSFPIVIDPNSVLPGSWGGWINGLQTVNSNPTIYVFVGALGGREHLGYVQFPLSAIPDSVQIDSVLLSLYLNLQLTSASQTMEVNDVTSPFGPYTNAQAQDSSYLNDFNNGTYTTFDIINASQNSTLAPINLGSQGATDVRHHLCRDTFQVALANNNQPYKRFSSNHCSIDVYYATCTGVAPTVVETFHQDQTCSSPFGASTVMTTGNASFYWAHNGDTSGTQTGLAPGNYSVFVNDTSGCGSVMCISILASQTINTVVTASDASCAGNADGMASATTSGGPGPFSYVWSTSDTSSSISNLSPATYSVIASDTNGCTDTTSFTIGAPAAVTVNTSGTNASCNGLNDGSATASAAGGTGIKTYVWSSGDTTASASNLLAGTYYVTATDVNGCTGIDSVVIGEPTGFTISALADSMVSCNGANDGGITSTITSGSGNFAYAWSNSASTASIGGLSPGTYIVTVTNSSTGCFKIDSTTITEPAVLVPTTAVTSHVSCNGLGDGVALSTPNGGVAPYSYLWSNSATTAAANNLTAGTYTVTVTDTMGCMATDTVSIVEPTALTASTSLINAVSCHGLMDGSASVIATGGTGVASFLWSNSDSTATVTNLAAGTYTVVATDSNGCTATDSVTITSPSALVTTVIGNNVSCNGLSDGSATVMATGGTGSASFLWSNSATAAAISGLGAGTYTVVATDSNGCSTTDSVTITAPAAIDVTVTQSGQTLSANQNGATYQWLDCNNGFAPINSATNQTFSAATSGNFAVEITVNGCVDTSACTAVTVVGTAAALNPGVDFALFPNPSTGRVKVRVENAGPDPENLRIFSLTGRMVVAQVIDKTNTEFDLSHLADGVYVVQYRGRMKKLILRK